MPPVDAIRLRPNLKFDKHDRLIQIDLQYSRDDNVTPTQCLDVFGRLVDWQVGENGPLRADPAGKIGAADKAAGWFFRSHATPSGLSYFVHHNGRKGGYVSGFFREGVQDALFERSIFSAFIYVDGKPHCFVTLNFDVQN